MTDHTASADTFTMIADAEGGAPWFVYADGSYTQWIPRHLRTGAVVEVPAVTRHDTPAFEATCAACGDLATFVAPTTEDDLVDEARESAERALEWHQENSHRAVDPLLF